jgi:Holliday junction resolvase RusA-like endonuclease
MTSSKVDKSPKPYTLEFTLKGLPKTTNGSHEHWRVKHGRVKAWKMRVVEAAWPNRPAQPLKSARITYIRYSSVECDYDNLVISFKAIQDGLKQAGIITDDRRHNVKATYLWRYIAPKKGMIQVTVEAANEDD